MGGLTCDKEGFGHFLTDEGEQFPIMEDPFLLGQCFKKS